MSDAISTGLFTLMLLLGIILLIGVMKAWDDNDWGGHA